MKKKYIVLFLLVTLLFSTVTTYAANINYQEGSKNQPYENPLLKGAWLKEKNGVKILYISGTNYEMGYQLGYLLKEPYMRSYRAYIHHSEHELGITHEDLLNAWNKNEEYIPEEYKEEMQGRADALNLTFEEVAVIETLNQFLFAFNKKACCGLVAWGPATADGKLYHVRSHDCTLKTPFDPLTGIPDCENEHLIIRKPDNGYASISPTTILDVGCEGGFNEKGISIGYKASLSDDNSMYGAPSTIRQLMVLDHASTLDEAVEIINSNATIGLNFIISDGKTNQAVVVEQSANHSYVGTWDNPVESIGRFWSIDHVVRRGNCYLDPTLSSNQTGLKYNDKNIISWLISPYFRQYVHLSKAIEKNWGNLDLNSSMNMIRNVYRYRVDPIHLLKRIIVRLGAWDQWVVCPETGDILVAFAQNGKSAFNSPVIHINLFEVLETQEI